MYDTFTTSESLLFPPLDISMGAARVQSSGRQLCVSTGCVKRHWELTETGLRTIQLTHIKSGKKWIGAFPRQTVDWDMDLLSGSAILEGVLVSESDDDGFTSRHLQTDVMIRYPETGGRLVYRIWCYPGAPGLRTQLLIGGSQPQSCPGGLPQLVIQNGRWEEEPGSMNSPLLKGIKLLHLKLENLPSGLPYILAVRCQRNADGSLQKFWLRNGSGASEWTFHDEGLVRQTGSDSHELQMHSFRIPPEQFLNGSCDLFITQPGEELFANLFDVLLLTKQAGSSCSNEDETPDFSLPAGYECIVHLTAPSCENEDVSFRNTTEQMPIDTLGAHVSFAGYLSDTQRLNSPATELLKETGFNPVPEIQAENAWANLMVLEDDSGCGLTFVKESHKCVNTPGGGANTGSFFVGPEGIEITGAGWLPDRLCEDSLHECWANWMLVHSGGADEQALALKQFDRIRYPVDPDRDIYIMANTWGSDRLQVASVQENVLREMQSQADLGIDVQQIDAGWQGLDYVKWRPAEEMTIAGQTLPVYPDGWSLIKKEAKQLNLKMGLWFASSVGAEDILRNWQEGGFSYFKLDYTDFETMDQLARMVDLLRRVFRETGPTCRVNWDVTEIHPRAGYFWGREYGNVYLENRMVSPPVQGVYQPYLVLRDAWQLSRYMNLNQFQLTVQNGEKIDLGLGDAGQHDPAYLMAQTFMGIPIFFQETQFYSQKAREVLKPLIALYKRHRKKIAQGYVFPLGDKPDNSVWSGFQCVFENRSGGYILLFRQIKNKESVKTIPLRFIRNTRISFTDMIHNITCVQQVDSSGNAVFEISEVPGFIFYEYKTEY